MPPVDFSPTDATELQLPLRDSGAGSALDPGTQLGAYVIRRLLGEGGMGRVYLAEQLHPVRRDVALKLIREQVASPLARAYFDVERQALAQMQHPAIAQVFDAGTTDHGHPYLAMEVVEGQPITEFCRAEELNTDERLALFARVCHGVQHAHQKGIIHRDLKPANVLVRRVDGEPMPKIIDFGIAIGGGAGAHGASVDSTVADHAGTAVYMSPEQASQRPRSLDTRSDVYSLGVMLYEVLTDSNAAALTSAAHRSLRAPHRTLLQAIEDPADASERTPSSSALLDAARRLPVELRAVLRKALASDRDERYDSAAALADDLERYREQRPIKAMPQTRAYFARTFVARHRIGLAAACFITVALVTGIALALNGLARARASAENARIEAAKAAQISDFVSGMLGGIDPDRAKGMDRKLMHLVLDSAADRAGRELNAQPAVRSAIERTIADSYASLGEFAVAATHYSAALAAGKAAGLAPTALALLTIRSADNLDNQGKQRDAIAAGEAALALVAALPANDRDRLHVESHLAGIEVDVGNAETGRARLIRVLGLQRRTLGDADPETLTTIEALAMVDSDTAHYDEARPLYESLIARDRARYGDEHSKTLAAINGLAVLDLEQKRFADAEKLLAPQVPIYERVFGPNHPTTLRLVSNLGGAIRQQGRNEEARPYYERALALSLKLYGADNLGTVIAESNLSLLLRDAGQLAAADQHARLAVAHADAAFGDNPYRGIMHRELATILIREQRYAEAEHELDLAWKVLSAAKGYGPTHPRSQDIVDTYVELYAAWKKPEREALWRSRKTAVATNAG